MRARCWRDCPFMNEMGACALTLRRSTAATVCPQRKAAKAVSKLDTRRKPWNKKPTLS